MASERRTEALASDRARKVAARLRLELAPPPPAHASSPRRINMRSHAIGDRPERGDSIAPRGSPVGQRIGDAPGERAPVDWLAAEQQEALDELAQKMQQMQAAMRRGGEGTATAAAAAQVQPWHDPSRALQVWARRPIRESALLVTSYR